MIRNVSGFTNNVSFFRSYLRSRFPRAISFRTVHERRLWKYKETLRSPVPNTLTKRNEREGEKPLVFFYSFSFLWPPSSTTALLLQTAFKVNRHISFINTMLFFLVMPSCNIFALNHVCVYTNLTVAFAQKRSLDGRLQWNLFALRPARYFMAPTILYSPLDVWHCSNRERKSRVVS